MPSRNTHSKLVFPYPALRGKHKGVALILMVILLAITFTTLLLGLASGKDSQTERERKTQIALLTARDALIGRAVRDDNRPGSLTCPDNDNNGMGPGSNCSDYVGRFPYKTLETDELLDDSGERIWYVLSPNFRDLGNQNWPPFPTSDTSGQLTLNGDATKLYAALLIAPGPTLSDQVRISAEINNRFHYLDGVNRITTPATSPPGTSPLPTFDFSSGAPTTMFNDRVLPISVDMIMRAVERRVIKEVTNCLKNFAASAGGIFPWAAPLGNLAYADQGGLRAGRIPKTYTATQASHTPTPGAFTGICTEGIEGVYDYTYFSAWRHLVFYQVSPGYDPNAMSPACTGGCLQVTTNLVAPVTNATAVVTAAGRVFPSQSARNSSDTDALNYLEADPATGINNSANFSSTPPSPAVYARNPKASTFNDVVDCLKEVGVSGTQPC